MLPFGDYSIGAAVQREGPRLKNEDPEAAGKLAHVQTYTITSDYFKTLGLTMVSGREFTAAEEAAVGGTPPVDHRSTASPTACSPTRIRSAS